jgi:hypothetical protein
MSKEETDADTVTLMALSSGERDWLDRLYAVWNESGPEGMRQEVWHASIVWHDPPDAPDADAYRGVDAVVEHLSERLEAVGHASVTVDGAWWAGGRETLVIDISLRSGGRSSGIEVDVPVFHVLRIGNGRVIEVWEYFQRHQALEAVGLAE